MSLLVDAYQSLGTCRVDVREWDIDILVSGNLKYLLGLPGIAFIYVKEELIERFEPALTGWFGRVNPFAFDARALDYAAEARRLDTGTPPVFAAVAARAGMELIEEAETRRIEARIEELSACAIESADRLGLEYVGPRDVLTKGATTAIRAGDPHAVEQALKARGVVSSARGDVIRIAPHFFTTCDDIDRAMNELIACTSSGIPFASSSSSVIAPVSHCPSHTPHPMHFSQLTTDVCSSVMASKGQAVSQSPHPIQASSSTSAT